MHIFILEDHPMTSALYKSILLERFITSTVTIASSCQEAYLLIQTLDSPFDLAIVDYSVPPYEEENLLNGADIISLIHKTYPDCKTLVITAEHKKIVLYGITKKIRPMGLIHKSSITVDNFSEIVKEIYDGLEYRCKVIGQCIEAIWKNDLLLDNHNRTILKYLCEGYKTCDLPTLIPLSESAIKKRINLIKKSFNLDKESALIQYVKKQGFV